jgi:hypothetical protein
LRPREFYSEMGKRRAAQIPKNPLMPCVLCLYSVGFGYRTIGNLTKINRALCRKWVRRKGIERGYIKKSKPFILPGLREKAEQRWQLLRQQTEERITKLRAQRIAQRIANRPTAEQLEERRRFSNEKQSKEFKERYATDPEFREYHKRKAAEVWQNKKNDEEFKQKKFGRHRGWVKRTGYKWPKAREYARAYNRKHLKEMIDNLDPKYVRSLLCDNRDDRKNKPLRPEDIPDDLVALKTEQLRLMRELKQQTK